MRVLLDEPPFWFHDLGNCLHDCLAVLLLARGFDPVEALGAVWQFHHDPAQVRGEEFYHPTPRPTLGETMFPFHPVRARWRHPADGAAGWDGLRQSLREGRLAIAAVDNFHMPIRPAFGDVHAAHLVVVWGYDDDTGEAYVLEPTPPLYRGPIPIADFLRARGSGNEARPETRDYFFAGPRIAHRWIDVEFTGPPPVTDAPWTAAVIRSNVDEFRDPTSSPAGRGGLDGLRHWLGDIRDRAHGGNAEVAAGALGELYGVGWAAQGAAALHADFLRAAGRRLGRDELVQAGRQVDRLANEWTALRVFGAHGSTGALRVADQLGPRSRRLLAGVEEALDRLDATAAALVSEPAVAGAAR
ncbi:BtrH N-terminal domain-containing protein [Micromonospora sp. NPDC051300]|uniref:BtrH N-terminal domain-containing protein n=1 Tax=Micromonospora sp. NPDC051300 TaxID=3364286 RepID=UPI003796254D